VLERAKDKTAQSAAQPLSLIDHSLAHLFATTGHVHLQAGDHDAARAALTAALDQLPPTARRNRILILVDLATTELRTGNFTDAGRHAITAADLLHTITYATGALRLRAFRAIAARPLDPQTLRALDDHLAA
jgi:ATP/maltotriose-dependent transcriptional regulator MalT